MKLLNHVSIEYLLLRFTEWFFSPHWGFANRDDCSLVRCLEQCFELREKNSPLSLAFHPPLLYFIQFHLPLLRQLEAGSIHGQSYLNLSKLQCKIFRYIFVQWLSYLPFPLDQECTVCLIKGSNVKRNLKNPKEGIQRILLQSFQSMLTKIHERSGRKLVFFNDRKEIWVFIS